MTKRKASVALDDDDQHDPVPTGVISRDDSRNNNVGNTSNITENDNANDNRPLTMNGTSDDILVDGRTVKLQKSDNQNDNSNGSSVCTNNNQGTDTSSSNQQHNKGKKERADNWSNAEIQVLHRGIESRRDVFYGPPSQATKKNRELAWEAITKEVNAVSTTPRTISQVMKKFKNEKCRAKRKFMDPDKDSHTNNHLIANSNNTNVSNSNTNSNSATATNDVTANLRQHQIANHNAAAGSQQQQLQHHQAHLMATTAATGCNESMTTPQATSINVVKLAPQNVAKTMIDLPGHVQHTIQMPNDDMVLIVPPDMDGLLSGVNIVSDGSGHHHFQKCSSNTLGNHQHSHHNQHAIQTLNTNQGLMNGTISNGMMTRTIPAGSMCSLVYSTGNEVCAPEHHITGQSSIASSHIAGGAQNLVHHRGSVNLDQGQQQHQLHHTPQATHQQHQHQHQQQHPQHPQHLQHQHHHHQQQQQAHPPNTHPQSHPNHHHLTQNQLGTSSTTAAAIGAANPSSVAVESQLKNLLFNLLLKDGQQSSSVPTITNSNQDFSKQRNDMLAIIASSLTKIESHLSKISKVAGTLLGPDTLLGESISNQLSVQAQQLVNPNVTVSATSNVSGEGRSGGLTTIGASDNNNNSFNISNPGPTPNITSNQRNNE